MRNRSTTRTHTELKILVEIKLGAYLQKNLDWANPTTLASLYDFLSTCAHRLYSRFFEKPDLNYGHLKNFNWPENPYIFP